MKVFLSFELETCKVVAETLTPQFCVTWLLSRSLVAKLKLFIRYHEYAITMQLSLFANILTVS